MKYLVLIASLILTGCAAKGNLPKSLQQGPVVQENPMVQELNDLPPINGPKMTIGVYEFNDKTGQRKPADNVANLSSAVTQGAEAWVIDALLQAGDGSWFEVVERGGMDHVIKERQLIRNTRENYEKDNPTPLAAMKFAGILLEGGIIGYDSNLRTGGIGARTLGLGITRQYRQDQVTISLRAVSVLTGEVLLNVQTKKTILSYGAGGDVFRFIEQGTQLIEYEDGVGNNESVTYAVRTAIEAAVLEMVYQGDRRGFWKINKQNNGEEE